MANHVQSKRKRVLAQTSGFTAVNAYVHKNRLAWLLNTANSHIVEDLRSKFADRREVMRMDVIYWGAAVWPQSAGHQKIRSKIAAHYGLAAQTLFVQMLIDKLKEEDTNGGGKLVNV